MRIHPHGTSCGLFRSPPGARPQRPSWQAASGTGAGAGSALQDQIRSIAAGGLLDDLNNISDAFTTGGRGSRSEVAVLRTAAVRDWSADPGADATGQLGWGEDNRWFHGRAVHLDPVTPTLKAPGTKRLRLEYDGLLSNFGFKFNLRRYTTARAPPT
jgi:hypothetical protein